ncbi:ChrR family anti-sigma-E factor [Bradyrhizobium arachidis]|uniref:ChrR family anti-sigma-E factor n=1 Tax=Bradyrhizobium TaxID=374 RepID=UPI00188C0F97|nr:MULTISPECIES: ChrR family anti-sigma-E factor [Bradyrhizobium]MDN4984142.1 ChrR family anti-sigma-E factor [Bradyrhizobium sp. WYCCWR 13022]QOZ51696.1 transcriptional regulator [Bradyrhizobium sp. CCBAU 53338]UVO38864.1 ChrR family anti-sigma-E factor [Bradyrhizobium arachidis]
MTIKHHPPEHLLAGFVSGPLEEADRLALAVHVAQCRSCRRLVGALERLGGSAIEQAAPVSLRADALSVVLDKVDAKPISMSGTTESMPPAASDLPDVLRNCRFGKKRRVAPGVSMQPLILPSSDQSRAFLLWSAPGAKMLGHTHSGTELTCVLKGSFAHESGHYGPGDFDYGDDDVNHQPIVGTEEPCLCFVAMSGSLKGNGWIGRLVSPFIRL